MGRIFLKLQPPIHRPAKFTCSDEKFVKELSVLFGNKSLEALEANSLVSESVVKGL